MACTSPLSVAPTSAGGRRRILIVDDEVAVLRALSRVLGLDGHEIVTAVDVGHALELLDDGNFSAILTDIHMPGADGTRLLSAVRERDLDVPVILMTGEPRVETAAFAVDHGALCYMVKPIDAASLRQAVAKAFARRQVLIHQRAAVRRFGAYDPSVEQDLAPTFDSAMESLWMAFQPIVRSADGTVFGYEALLRSDEPALPHPGAVLSAAEQLERLPELGRRIRALSARAFDDEPSGALLFVNLHPRDMMDPNLLDPDAPLSRMASRVVLEVTERAAMGDANEVRARIALLRRVGFRIAVDDLGAGYAGLTSFALLEPEFVKLDMSIVRDVNDSPIKQKLIGSVAMLCREMGVHVVAEGIESVAELETLRDLGCDLLQGFLFARPSRPFVVPSWPL